MKHKSKFSTGLIDYHGFQAGLFSWRLVFFKCRLTELLSQRHWCGMPI